MSIYFHEKTNIFLYLTIKLLKNRKFYIIIYLGGVQIGYNRK
mgnify:FL=1